MGNPGIMHIGDGLSDRYDYRLTPFLGRTTLQPLPKVDTSFGLTRDKYTSVEAQAGPFNACAEHFYDWDPTQSGSFSANEFGKGSGRLIPIEVADKVTDKSTTLVVTDNNVSLLVQCNSL